MWSNFLTVENLLNIADRIVVIAVIAIGMTMVIITAGIDLSVGSLVALSAVAGTWFIARVGGAEQAGVMAMWLGGLLAILLCAGVGLFSGMTVAWLDIPPFIVTLAMMLVASGFAYILSGGQSIYQLPDGFGWLGAGTTLNVPNAVILMLFLYLVAHVVMSHTTLGRYIYATGGNEEAARLSGVPTRKIKVFVYVVAGALAGLGGMIEASQLASGRPNSGLMYELYVIAAVVVGGTSLTGGEGKIFGTLIGAFIIAVIQNGMNLMRRSRSGDGSTISFSGQESRSQTVHPGALLHRRLNRVATLPDQARTRGRLTFSKASIERLESQHEQDRYASSGGRITPLFKNTR